MATAPQTIESRRAPRDIVSFRASVDGPQGSRGTLLIVDISPFGFMARCTMSLREGDAIVVRLPVVGARATSVVWSLGGRLGGAFADPVPAHSYARLLATAPHDRPSWHEF